MGDGGEVGGHRGRFFAGTDGVEFQIGGAVEGQGFGVRSAWILEPGRVPDLCVGIGGIQADLHGAAETITFGSGPGCCDDGRSDRCGARTVVWCLAPIAGLSPLEYEFAPAHDFFVGQPAASQVAAVESDLVDRTISPFAGDKSLAVLEAQTHGRIPRGHDEPLLG